MDCHIGISSEQCFSFTCSLLLSSSSSSSSHIKSAEHEKAFCVAMDKENQEQEKQVSKKSPSTQTEQERAFAASIHPQGAAYTMLEMIESDTSDDEEEDDEDDACSQGNFITGQDFVDLMFYEEGEESETEDEMEEEEEDDDDIDPDELSYEELLALGEIIGQESRGLSPEEISSTLSPYICKTTQKGTSVDRCVICQMEYQEDEELVDLRCEHPFHAACISPWLQIKKICPICSMEVIKQKT